MHTVLTTNNAFDCVLLLDDTGAVVSQWDADPKIVANYLRDGARPDEWHVGEWPTGFDPNMQDDETAAAELRTIAAYGRECGRDGQITDPDRRQFWLRDTA